MKRNEMYPTCVLCENLINLEEHEVVEYNEECETNYTKEELEEMFSRLEVEDFFDNLQYSEYNESKCVIIGSLGLWNGRREIEPCVCDDITQAVKKCINNTDFFKIELISGQLQISATHHDGTNSFSIILLNKKGCNGQNLDFENKHYHKKIKGYLY